MFKKILVFLIGLTFILSLSGCTEWESAMASHDFVFDTMQQYQQQETNPNYWMNYFYQMPTPEKTPYMINAMISSNQLDQLQPYRAEDTTVFFAHLFKQYPDKIEPWMSQIRFKGEQSKRIIFKAIWDSNTSSGRAYLKQIAQSSPSDAQLIHPITSHPPLNVLAEKMSPDTLDHLWAAFFVTGNVKFLKPIIHAANITPITKEQERTAAAATWSLITYGKTHYDLPCTYLLLSNETNPKEKKYLIDIAKEAKGKYSISCPEPG